MASPALSFLFSSPILGYPPASSAFAIFWPSHAGHVSDLLYITAAKCAGVSSKCKPVHAPPKQGESFGCFFFLEKKCSSSPFPFRLPSLSSRPATKGFQSLGTLVPRIMTLWEWFCWCW